MAYTVQRVDNLYVDPDKSNETEIEEYLNDREADGWTLVGMIPDHQLWDDNGMPDGRIGTMFVLHKPDTTEAKLLA